MKKRAIPTVSMRLPIRTRKLIWNLAKIAGKKQTNFLIDLIDAIGLENLKDIYILHWSKERGDFFDSDGFCKSDIGGICLRQGNRKLGNSRRFCVEFCNNP